MPIRRHTFAAAAAVLLSGCGHSPVADDTVCSFIFKATAVVTVRDSVSGAPLATGTTATLQDGGYSETLVVNGWDNPPSPETASALSSQSARPGTYTVTVQHPGYAPWARSGVTVESTKCGVETARLTARLVKLGS